MRGNRTAKPAKVRCAVYCRKSSEEGLESEFNSLDAQRESGEAYVASQKAEGWVCLPERYDDGGFSGGTMDRPALKRLLADIEAGNVDCVVVYKVDRLSRSLLDFARIMEVFERRGVSFVSVTQAFNTTHSMGRLTLNILLSFAQFEREIIGERIRDKIAAQRRRGKWAGGVPVLGYDVDRSGPSPKLVINAKEAARVREIYGEYLRLGSLLPLVEELDQRGWKNKAWKTKKGLPRGGAPFDRGSLYALLTNPLYAGRLRHKDEVHAGEHEAIVADDVFQRVQARLRRNGRSGGPEARNKHGALLRGLLVCKACGHAMTHTFTTKGQTRYRYYACTAAIKRGRKTCPSGSLPAAQIEAAVVDEVRGVARDPALREEVLRQALAHQEAAVAALHRERADLERELGRYHAELRALATGENRDAAARVADLHEQVAKAERRAGELRERLARAEREQVGAMDVEAAFGRFDDLWGEPESAGTRAGAGPAGRAGRVRRGGPEHRGHVPSDGAADARRGRNRGGGMITVKRSLSVKREARGRRRVEKTASPTPPVQEGRVPRITKLMALAIRLDRLIQDGTVSDQSELARLARVTQPRMTQILNLLHLAPDIQEALLFLPRVTDGKAQAHERMLRPIAAEVSWRRQREIWNKISPRGSTQSNDPVRAIRS